MYFPERTPAYSFKSYISLTQTLIFKKQNVNLMLVTFNVNKVKSLETNISKITKLSTTENKVSRSLTSQVGKG